MDSGDYMAFDEDMIRDYHYTRRGLTPPVRRRTEGSKSYMSEVSSLFAGLPFNSTGKYTLYPAPNGGNRILPSVYGRVPEDGPWLKADCTTKRIPDMNTGHLENILKLLRESHGNLTDRATSYLGKLHWHYQNQPDVQRKLEELALLLQQVEVDELYPVYGGVARELTVRSYTPPVEKIPVKVDDDLDQWDPSTSTFRSYKR